jgi:triphosphoribosyl-dephospho-CoA synthase
MKTPPPIASPISVGEAATLACLYEAAAPKPGNVHPGAAFADVTFEDFEASARVIGPVMQEAQSRGVGQTILDALQATRDTVGTNTNLGMILLFAPLAAIPASQNLSHEVDNVLANLTFEDTRLVYQAIRLANAGGLGQAAEADVSSDPPPNLSLVEAMRLAADRDLIARQYTNAFADVFGGTAKFIVEAVGKGLSVSQAIVWAHIRQLAAAPDSLIQRKCGPEIAGEASERAAAVLSSGSPGTTAYLHALDELDRWLRADGHRRNPGTTADLIAAGLFVIFREGQLELTNAKW